MSDDWEVAITGPTLFDDPGEAPPPPPELAGEATRMQVAQAIWTVDFGGDSGFAWDTCTPGTRAAYLRMADAATGILAARDAELHAVLADLEHHRDGVLDLASYDRDDSPGFNGGRALGLGEAIDEIKNVLNPHVTERKPA